jgi:hypothetical protein
MSCPPFIFSSPLYCGSETNSFAENNPLNFQAASKHDSVGSHIPQKNKVNIWTGDYIEPSLLLKSAKELVSDPQYSGELKIKGGQLIVGQEKTVPY